MIRQGRHRRGRAHDNGLRVRVGRRFAAGTHEMSILVNDQRAQHSSMHETWALCIVGMGFQLRDPPAKIAAHHRSCGALTRWPSWSSWSSSESRGLDLVRVAAAQGEMKSGHKIVKARFSFLPSNRSWTSWGQHANLSNPTSIKRPDRSKSRTAARLVHGMQKLGWSCTHECRTSAVPGLRARGLVLTWIASYRAEQQQPGPAWLCTAQTSQERA